MSACPLPGAASLWRSLCASTGQAVDVGGGNEFGGADEEDEGVEDKAETKLDQFWQFSDIENEVSFKSFKEFKRDYYAYFVAMCRRLAKEGKVSAEYRESLKDNLMAAMRFIEANFDSLQVCVCDCPCAACC